MSYPFTLLIPLLITCIHCGIAKCPVKLVRHDFFLHVLCPSFPSAAVDSIPVDSATDVRRIPSLAIPGTWTLLLLHRDALRSTDFFLFRRWILHGILYDARGERWDGSRLARNALVAVFFALVVVVVLVVHVHKPTQQNTTHQ